MNRKPFGPRTHAAIDYGFTATLLLAPGLFKLTGAARTLCYAFGGAAGVLTAFTDQPLALRRVVPFRVQGRIDTPFVPTLLLLPWAAGALEARNARRFFVLLSAVVLANYLLTDFDAPDSSSSSCGRL